LGLEELRLFLLFLSAERIRCLRVAQSLQLLINDGAL
jgi:hypothetical protein|tara:strand:+ start:92 stop:202 length:111 start_codon:yes stop_codon:yes gene_type:complete